MPGGAEMMSIKIPMVRRLMGTRPASAMEKQGTSFRNGHRSSNNSGPCSSDSAEGAAVGIAGGARSSAPKAGSLGEQYLWLLARRDETIVFSHFGTRVQTALRRARCSTWGDLAALSEDDLHSVPGVGDTTIGNLHQDLERGRVGLDRPVPIPTDPAVAFREKYGWMAEAADEEIDESLFDTRTLNALIRSNIRTWGDLGALSEASFLNIENVGVLSVRRLNEALSAYEYKAPEPSDASSADVTAAPQGDQGHASAGLDLRTSAEWSTLISDNATLGELLAALGSDTKVPKDVRDEVDALLAIPLSRLSSHTTTPLGELVEELLSQAVDLKLLAARECVRVKPTLEELGEAQGLTRERIRQKVATDTKLVLSLLQDEQFRAVRWAAEQIQAEFGLAIPSENEIVERWRKKVGEHRFEMLRWVSGYVYKDDWLLNGSRALADLEEALRSAVGDEWLVETDELAASLSIHVHPEVALSFLLDTGQWRDIGDGWLVRWDGALQHKAERVLRLTCRPMTPEELIEAIGHGSIRSLKSQYSSTMIRVDKKFRLALPEWEYEEYEGILTEITQRIERGGGVASKAAIIDEFTNDFGVSVTAINMNLGLPIFNVIGDAVRFADAFNFDPMPPSTVASAVHTTEGWGGTENDHRRTHARLFFRHKPAYCLGKRGASVRQPGCTRKWVL